MTESNPQAEPVGSIADEAFKLLHAMSSQHAAADAPHGEHVCSTSWCPVCQVVGLVRDHPDAVAQVTESAAQLTRSVRALIETALTPRDQT